MVLAMVEANTWSSAGLTKISVVKETMSTFYIASATILERT